jgi:hypothetical protein
MGVFDLLALDWSHIYISGMSTSAESHDVLKH